MKKLLNITILSITFLLFISCSKDSDVDNKSTGFVVSNTQILFNGSPILLRGVAIGSLIDDGDNANAFTEGMPFENKLSEYYSNISQDWKANCVRISIRPGHWRDNKTTIKTEITKHIQAAVEAGLFVVLDYHPMAFPDGRTYDATDTIEDSDFDLALNFWDEISELVTDKHVIFELWNEPINQSASVNDSTTWSDLKPYYERLIETIRNNGSNQLLLTASVNYADSLTDVKNDLLDDDNLAYVVHIYPDYGDYGDAEQWLEALDGLERIKPIFVTEWGYAPDEASNSQYFATTEDYAEPLAEFMQEHNIHWTAWSYHGWNVPGLLTSDWETPNTAGEYIKTLLRN